MRPSPEQQAIMDAVVAGEPVDVLAYAGSGKTSLLNLCIEVLPPSARILCLAFNAHTAKEGKQRFGNRRNVRVSTYHALAYGPIGSRYQRAGRLVSGIWQVRQAIQQRFRLELGRLGSSRSDAAVYAALDALRSFCQSADEHIGQQHLPPEFLAAASGDEASFVVDLTHKIWNAMGASNDDMPITHDVYFKRFCLQNPRLPYDVILVDERQDLDLAMMVLAMRQPAQMVFVGDIYQSLYRFRGAIAEQFDLSMRQMPLTHSWRFGPEIAAQANKVLRARGAEHPLIGAGAAGKVSVGGDAPTAVLARSNVGVVLQSLHWMNEGKGIGIIGGTEEVVSTIEGAYDLWRTGSSRHPRFRFFESWLAVIMASETRQGQDLRPFVRFIGNFGREIPDMLRRLREGAVDVASADVVVATVHKFKGLESDHVLLADDFQPFVSIDENGVPIVDVDEANVAYVALTRARQHLQLGAYNRVLRESLALLSTPVQERLLVQSDRIEAPEPSVDTGSASLTSTQDAVEKEVAPVTSPPAAVPRPVTPPPSPAEVFASPAVVHVRAEDLEFGMLSWNAAR